MKAFLQRLGILRPDGSMSARMRRTLCFTAAALLLIAACNGVILSRVAQNRAAPDAELALSSREFATQSGLFEDSGRFVRIRYQTVCEEVIADSVDVAAIAPPEMDDRYCAIVRRNPFWLDEDKLAALGYRGISLADQNEDRRFPEKKVFVVLELDGPAYAQYVAGHEAARDRAAARLRAAETRDEEARRKAAERLDKRKTELRDARETDSRLFLVDAGLDAAALRRRYPDKTRYAIAPGRVGIMIADRRKLEGKDTWRLVPEAARIHMERDTVFVPLQFAQAFAAIERQNAKSARLLLAVGARLEPWVKDLRGE